MFFGKFLHRHPLDEFNATADSFRKQSALTRKLSAYIYQLEQLPVDVYACSGDYLRSGKLLFFNINQLKRSTQRHFSVTNVKNWKREPDKTDLLAVFQAIEIYLVIRDSADGSSEGDICNSLVIFESI